MFVFGKDVDNREYQPLMAGGNFNTFKVLWFKIMQYKILLLISIQIGLLKSLNIFTQSLALLMWQGRWQ